MQNQITHLRTPESQFDARAAWGRFFSTTLGVEKHYFIYLPPEYAEDQRRFPALYLLRGHEREWINPSEDDTRNGTTIIDVYERLRQAAQVGPLIMVMPSMASDDNCISGLMTDFRAPELVATSPGIGNGRFESYFVDDVIRHIDRNYRTIPQQRAVAGFSLGGAMAVKVAARHPALFASVSAYDGSFAFTSDWGRTVRVGDSLLAGGMFDPNFGVPRDLAHMTANNPANLVMQADAAQLQRLTWCIQYGPEHVEPWGSNFYRGEHLLRVLQHKGVRNNVPSPVIPNGNHNWATVHRHMELALPLHWSALQAATAPAQ